MPRYLAVLMIALAVGAALALAGAQALAAPEVTAVDPHLRAEDARIKGHVVLRVHNPNPFPLTVDESRLDLAANGRDLGPAVVEPARLPPRGDAEVRVAIDVPIEEAAAAARPGEDVRVEVAGLLHIDILGFDVPVPVLVTRDIPTGKEEVGEAVRAAEEAGILPKNASRVLEEHPEVVEHALEVLEEHPQLVERLEEDPGLAEDVAEVVREDPAVVEEVAEVAKEDPEAVQDLVDVVEEEPRLARGVLEILRDDPQLARDVARILSDDPDLTRDIAERLREDPRRLAEVLARNPDIGDGATDEEIRRVLEELRAS